MDVTSRPSLSWPRLARSSAVELAVGLDRVSLAEARLSARTTHPSALPASNAVTVAPERIAALQHDLRSIADRKGWPAAPSVAFGDEIDREWGHVLFEAMSLTPASASDVEVWNFLALVVVPDLARWRGSPPYDPFVEPATHVLGRLWWREWTLGRELIDGDGFSPLDGEEMTALFRRADLVANPSVARAIVRNVLRLPAGPERRSVVKELVIKVLHTTPAVCVDALEDGQLDALIDELMARGR